MADEYQDALDRANSANEARYQAILQGYNDLHGRVMGDLDGVGDVQRRDIDRQFRNLSSSNYQRLVNRGFGNSTIPASVERGVQRERSDAQARLGAQLARERVNADTRVTQGRLGVMERREDEAPDLNQMIALSRGLGSGGYGARPMGIHPGMYQQAYMGALGRMMPRGWGGHQYRKPTRNLARQWWAKKNRFNQAPMPMGPNSIPESPLTVPNFTVSNTLPVSNPIVMKGVS